MSKRAIILAGGKGTRLKPYTVVLPKPLVPIGDYPILEIIIKQLAKCKFDHITITVNHLAEIIQAFFGDGSKWGIKIDYSHEDMPLSTMGPLKLIKDLPENFLVMNGDVLTDLNFNEFYNLHTKSEAVFTISSYKRQQISEYGVLEVNNDRLVGFVEKPKLDYIVSMGIYMASRGILDYIPTNTFFGFDHLMYSLIANKKHPNVILHSGKWLDIGRPDDYAQAIDLFEKNEFI